MLAQLQALEPAFVADLARQALNLPQFTPGSWTARPIQHLAVIETTGGLFVLEGDGWEGSQPRQWSLVLKLIRDPGDECQPPGELCYWRREMLAYQGGLLAGLPGGLRAPRCFGASEQPPGGWLWLEQVAETAPAAWGPAQFEQAARRLGQFAGAYCNGRPAPDAPWLCHAMLAQKVSDGEWWAKFTNPASPKNAWMYASVQALFPPAEQARVLAIWREKQRLLAAYDRLPRVFCHNDAHRANLMLQEPDADGLPALAAIDWGFCGPGGLGSDLGQLVGSSLTGHATSEAEALALEESVLAGYSAGLRDAGWPDLAPAAWLGYAISLALYWGTTLPCAVAQEEMAGRDTAAARPGWALLRDLSLARAEQVLAMLARG